MVRHIFNLSNWIDFSIFSSNLSKSPSSTVFPQLTHVDFYNRLMLDDKKFEEEANGGRLVYSCGYFSCQACFCIFLSLLQQNSEMSEPSKRNSTRPKKIPKYLQLEEAEYGIYSGSRVNEPKDPRNNTLETNQLARLLVKFLNSSNQKLRDYTAQDVPDSLDNKHPPLPENERNREAHSRNNDRRAANTQNDPSYLPSKKVKENHERVVTEPPKASVKAQEKKGNNPSKGVMTMSTTIQNDLNYHNMLGEHIKSNLSDTRNLSPEMLMNLKLFKDAMQQQGLTQPPSETKDKDRKKRQTTPSAIKGATKETSHDLKPFKRQSYHVAIAYHIHLKQHKSGNHPSAKTLDPTHNARRMREQAEKRQ